MICVAGRAAEDPARFLVVEKWSGTVAKDLAISGGGPYGTGTTEFSLVHHLNLTVLMEPSGFTLPFPNWGFDMPGQATWRTDGARVPIPGTASERVDTQSVRQTFDGVAIQSPVFMRVDTAAKEYMLQFPMILGEVAITVDGITTRVPQEGGVWWGPIVTNTLPETGLRLSGSATIYLDQSGPVFFTPVSLNQAESLEFLQRHNVKLSWDLAPEGDLEVLVEPVDYETWVPEGNFAEPEMPGPRPIEIKAKLQKKGGGTTTLKAEKFLFELANVSREPGVCMNWPPPQKANRELDLQFESDKAIDPTFVIDSLHAETMGAPVQEARATVSCFDYGAYGTIKVTALVNGARIVGHLAPPAKALDEIPLPRRVPTSFVAEYWSENNGAADLPSNDDSEEDPPGDGHQGDGLTLYEEYRGFSVRKTHTRTNPKKKDLFVLNEAGSHGDKGMELFEEVSSVKLHRVITADFGFRPGLVLSPLVLNINHSTSVPHVVDQHAIWMVTGPLDMGASSAENRGEFSANSTPGTKSRVVINPKLPQRQVGMHVVGGDGQISVRPAKDISPEASTVAHEIAHCCSIYHHGKLNTTEAVVEYRSDHGNHLVDVDGISDAYRVRWENDRPYEVANGETFRLGIKNGTHSGDEGCLMRYDSAEGYLSNTDPGIIYVSEEVSGSGLCTSAKGTGVNAAAQGTPWPRFGDAQAGLGNCTLQFCINDLYASSPKHKR